MKINEIFHSIQGESTRAGYPCTFVRLAECSLRCGYCDTAYAFHDGREMTQDAVMQEVQRAGCRFVTITGGEPLLQEEVHPLIARLLDEGFDVQIETSGAIDITPVDRRARVILDVKTPGSGMLERMDWENVARLRAGDEVKFVLTGREDYVWARETIRRLKLPTAVPLLLSPAHGVLDPADLAEWMKQDHLEARLHLQIHKYIWGADRRGV